MKTILQVVSALVIIGPLLPSAAAGSVPQDAAAEAAWQKLVESIEKAKSLSVKFQCELATSREGTEMKSTSSGALRLKEGNRLNLSFKAFAGLGGPRPETRLVSSGTQMKLSMTLGTETHGGQTDAPSDLAPNLAAGLARLGLALPLSMLTTPVGHGEIPIAQGVPDFSKVFEASGFKGGKGEGTALTVTYQLRDLSPGTPKDAPSLTCTIWYEPRTFKLLKRSVSLAQGPAQMKMLETYEEFAVNGAVPDADFALPEPAGEKPVRTLTAHRLVVQALAWSPDGKALVSGGMDSTIRLWDAAAGKELRTFSSNGRQFESVAVSPDGKLLAAGGYVLPSPGEDPYASKAGGVVVLWDPATGKELKTLSGVKSNVGVVRFSQDGKSLAAGGSPMKIWELAGGRELRSLESPFGHGPSLSFSPDLRTFAAQENESLKLWELAGGGKELRTLPGFKSQASKSAFSPDGTLLAAANADGTVQVWEVASGREVWSAVAHGEGVRSIAWSPDGRTLASGGGDRSIKVWEAAGGKLLRRLQGHADAVGVLVFRPDGRMLASAGGPAIKFWALDSAPGPLVPEASPPAVKWQEGLVGYWRLDEKGGASARDSSGEGNHGTYLNAPEPSEDVPSLKFADPGCRMFAPGKAQSVEVPDSDSLRLTGSLTLAAWIRPAAENGESHYPIIDDKFEWTGSEAKGGYLLRLSSKRNLMFNLTPDSGGAKGCWCAPVPAGAWSHVAGVYDAKTLTARAYVNGKLSGTETGVAAPGATKQHLLIGASGVNRFSGAIDEVRIYNRALSEAEVRSLAGGQER